MPLSQTPGAIAARNRRAAAAAQRDTAELTLARRAVEAARRTLEEAQRPRVYTTPPSTAPSAVRARERRAAARIDLATYDLSQAEARLARANAPRAPRVQAPPPAAPVQAADPFETALENIYDMAERAVNAGRGDTQINISVVRRSVSLIGRLSAPYTDVYSRSATDIYSQTEDLRNTILYQRDGYTIVSISAAAGRRIVGVRRFQVYLDGPTHCVFGPIISLLERKVEDSESDKRRAEMTALINKAKSLASGVYAGGVPQDMMQEVANKLRVKITITTPCDDESNAQVYAPRGQPVAVARFHLTRLNHLEPSLTLDNPIQVKREQMKEVYEELRTSGEYYEYGRWGAGITWIRTLKGRYVFEQTHNNFVKEQEEAWGVSTLCAIKDEDVSAYIKSALVTPGHCDTCDTKPYERVMPDGVVIPGLSDYECLDMEKAYTQGMRNPHYVGFPARITDFRETEVYRGIGFYTLIDIVLTEKVKQADDLLGGLFVNGAVFPSSSLAFLDAHGCKYRIISGAWGTKCDVDFSDPTWLEREHDTAPPLYSKTVGTWMICAKTQSFYVHGDEDFLSHVAAVNKGSNVISVFPEQRELSVTHKREHAPHLMHVAAFVTDYVKIAMLIQIMSMDMRRILRVGCDCVYTTEKNAKLTGAFRRKHGERMKTNIASGRYMLVNPSPCIPYAPDKIPFMIEMHRGPAGCGKTYSVANDRGIVRLLIVAPSHLLAASIAKKYDVDTAVWAQLLSDIPAIWQQFLRYGYIYIDECSQLSEGCQRKLIERFGKARILFGGDMCQLPPFEEKGKKVLPFNESLCENIVDHTKHFRCKCKFLADALGKMRINISSAARCAQIARASFQSITMDELVNIYNPYKDVILTHTKVSRDCYSARLKEAGKPDRFRVTARVGKYYNGNIVYEIEAPLTAATAELQHSSTVHSVQGLEVERDGNLFLDQSTLEDANMTYTACSRAQDGSQIYIIVHEEAKQQPPLKSEICRFTETASVVKAKWLMSRTEEELDTLLSKDVNDEYLSELREFGEAYANGRRDKKRHEKRVATEAYCNRVICYGGKIHMGYRYSEENRNEGRNEGRLFCIGPGMQKVPGGVRGFFLGDTDVVDVDMCSAHPCLALKVARHHGLAVPLLERYIADRAVFLAENNMVKQDALIMLNREKRAKGMSPNAMALDAELKLIQDTVWTSPEYNFKRTRCNKVKGDYNLKGSYLNKLMCHMENMLLQRVVASLTNVHGLYFDGLMTTDKVDIEALNALTADHGIKWAIKPHCSRIRDIIANP